MEIKFHFLARAAEGALDGSITVFGADFDRVVAPAFPFPMPASLVVRLGEVPPDCGDGTFEADIFDPDQKSMLLSPIFGPFKMVQIRKEHSVVRRGSATIVLNFGIMPLPMPGNYEIRYKINISDHTFDRKIEFAAEVADARLGN